MSNDLVTTNNYTQEKINLIKSTVAKDSTDLELQFFIEQCKRTGLDPITRQIYFIKDKNGKVNVQTSIDGLRLIAERSDKYEGQTSPQWCGEDGTWKDVWLNKTPPSACRVGVYKKGFRDALYAIAVFEEYAQRNYKGELNYIWGSKPALMLAKVAEALALRKAFPNDMSGIYTQDEYTPETRPSVKLPEMKNNPSVISSKEIEVATGYTGNEDSPPIEAYQDSGDVVQDQEAIVDENFIITFGKKYPGRTIGSIPKEEVDSYVDYLIRSRNESGRPFPKSVEDFIIAAGHKL